METATYGSEFFSERTCVYKMIDLRNTLRYLGITILTKSYMFIDNKSVTDNDIHPHAKLHKRHITLYFNWFWEATKYRILSFYHVSGGNNQADILSKYWIYTNIWGIFHPLLFWMRDTTDLLDMELKRDGGQEKGE